MGLFRWIKVDEYIILFPFPPIENDQKWLFQLLPIKYELKLLSEVMPRLLAIHIQIQAMREIGHAQSSSRRVSGFWVHSGLDRLEKMI